MGLIRAALLASTMSLAACAGRASIDSLPDDARLPAAAKIPSDATLAIYMPPSMRQSRIFVRGFWLTPGKALEESVSAVGKHFFTTSSLVDANSTTRYGLLLTLQPEWKLEGSDLKMTMRYRVFSKNNAVALEGEKSDTESLGDFRDNNAFFNAALRTAQLVVVDVIARLQPTAAKYPVGYRVADVDPRLFVQHDKPRLSGTGFFINGSGQLMTAAHVLHDCALIEIRKDDKTLPARPAATSALLDVAVVNTGVPSASSLPLRRGQALNLGEPVVNVGFPLQSLLGQQPSLTRGNVSSFGALAGSSGHFQFSAPIQPGSSGGPVVSDAGELLGLTQSTLNPAPLIQRGVLPQNVNFALEAKYLAQFLRRNKIAFNEVNAGAKGDAPTGNTAALGAVASVACYQ